MKLRIALYFICFFYAVVMHGQTFTLQGKVVDEQQQPIELVTVSVAKQGNSEGCSQANRTDAAYQNRRFKEQSVGHWQCS